MQAPPLIEAAKHTRCAGDGLANWSTLLDVARKPYIWLGATPVAVRQLLLQRQRRQLPFDASRGAPSCPSDPSISSALCSALRLVTDGLHRIRSDAADLVEVELGPMAAYCNYYQACAALPAPPPALPPSESVARAAAEVAAPLGGFGAYDAAHVRQADKVLEQNAGLRVPRLTSRSLAQRLLVLLPSAGGAASATSASATSASATSASATSASSVVFASESAAAPSASAAASEVSVEAARSSSPRRLYVATDAPELLQGYGCVRACYEVAATPSYHTTAATTAATSPLHRPASPAPLPLCQLSRPRSFTPASTAVTLCVGGHLGRVARRAAQVGAAACAPLGRAALHAVLVRPANAPTPPRRPARRSPSLPPLSSPLWPLAVLSTVHPLLRLQGDCGGEARPGAGPQPRLLRQL